MRHLSFVDVNYTFEDDTMEVMERKPAKKGSMTVKKKSPGHLSAGHFVKSV